MTKAWHTAPAVSFALTRGIKESERWMDLQFCSREREPNQGTDVAAEKARLSSSSFLFSAAVSARAHRQTHPHSMALCITIIFHKPLSWLVQEIGKATCEDTAAAAGALPGATPLYTRRSCCCCFWVMRKWICLIYHDVHSNRRYATWLPPAQIYFARARSSWPLIGPGRYMGKPLGNYNCAPETKL